MHILQVEKQVFLKDSEKKIVQGKFKQVRNFFFTWLLPSARKYKNALTLIPATVKIKDLFHTFSVFPTVICIIGSYSEI